MEQHIKIVAILNIINGILSILGGFLCFFLLAGMGAFIGETIAQWILSGVGIFLGILLFLMGLPGVIGGFQLLKYKESGRILTLIAAFISLINFPIGTALGIYSIWILLHKDIGTVIENSKGAPLNI